MLLSRVVSRGIAAPVRHSARLALCRAASGKAAGDAVATTSKKGGELSTDNVPEIDKATLSAFTGAPTKQLENRLVKIYQQPQTVQNATQNMIAWRLQWEDDQTKRWSNPLMGWTSTSDPLSNTHMTLEFATPEDAARYCDQNGWKYEVIESAPNKEIFNSPKMYSANFKWKGPKGRDFPDLYVPPPPPPPPPKK